MAGGPQLPPGGRRVARRLRGVPQPARRPAARRHPAGSRALRGAVVHGSRGRLRPVHAAGRGAHGGPPGDVGADRERRPQPPEAGPGRGPGGHAARGRDLRVVDHPDRARPRTDQPAPRPEAAAGERPAGRRARGPVAPAPGTFHRGRVRGLALRAGGRQPHPADRGRPAGPGGGGRVRRRLADRDDARPRGRPLRGVAHRGGCVRPGPPRRPDPAAAAPLGDGDRPRRAGGGRRGAAGPAPVRAGLRRAGRRPAEPARAGAAAPAGLHGGGGGRPGAGRRAHGRRHPGAPGRRHARGLDPAARRHGPRRPGRRLPRVLGGRGRRRRPVAPLHPLRAPPPRPEKPRTDPGARSRTFPRFSSRGRPGLLSRTRSRHSLRTWGNGCAEPAPRIRRRRFVRKGSAPGPRRRAAGPVPRPGRPQRRRWGAGTPRGPAARLVARPRGAGGELRLEHRPHPAPARPPRRPPGAAGRRPPRDARVDRGPRPLPHRLDPRGVRRPRRRDRPGRPGLRRPLQLAGRLQPRGLPGRPDGRRVGPGTGALRPGRGQPAAARPADGAGPPRHP